MKKLLILLLISGNLFAQEYKIDFSPLSESAIYEFIGGVNPNINPNYNISNLVAGALSEWAEAIISNDPNQPLSTFLYTNRKYVTVSNVWLSSSVKERFVIDMMFADTDPLIIRNMDEEDLLDCIINSKEVGVSFVHIRNVMQPEDDVDIYLILLKK